MASPKEVLDFLAILPKVYGDLREVVGFLKKTFGDNYIKVIQDAGDAAREAQTAVTKEQRLNAARKFSALFERATRP